MSAPLDSPLAVAALVVGVVLVAVALTLGALRRRTCGYLVFVNGPRKGESVALRPGRVRIGALNENDIVIPGKQVSRYHAELRVTASTVLVWDLESHNETRVNGASVKTRTIEPGDVIGIAGVELRYGRERR